MTHPMTWMQFLLVSSSFFTAGVMVEPIVRFGRKGYYDEMFSHLMASLWLILLGVAATILYPGH